MLKFIDVFTAECSIQFESYDWKFPAPYILWISHKKKYFPTYFDVKYHNNHDIVVNIQSLYESWQSNSINRKSVNKKYSSTQLLQHVCVSNSYSCNSLPHYSSWISGFSDCISTMKTLSTVSRENWLQRKKKMFIRKENSLKPSKWDCSAKYCGILFQ